MLPQQHCKCKQPLQKNFVGVPKQNSTKEIDRLREPSVIVKFKHTAQEFQAIIIYYSKSFQFLIIHFSMLLFFAAYVICKKNYSFSRVVFLFFRPKFPTLFIQK